MAAVDPPDPFICMREDGPIDTRFRVAGGELLHSRQRDARFPYLYKVPTHTLVHDPKYLTKIIVHVVDTSVDARIERAKFANTLSVPLGPNILMKKYGNWIFLNNTQPLTIIDY